MTWKGLDLMTIMMIVGKFQISLCTDLVLHAAVVSDYLIMSSNVDTLSTLGISCVPELKNNVEVSVKYKFAVIVMDRKTVCTSTQGTISGEEIIGQNTTISLRFGSFIVILLLLLRILVITLCSYHQ